jgi:DNA modification methylase
MAECAHNGGELMTKHLLGSLELNRIYQMDCIEGMWMIPDKSVDLIVIDPPYNIGKDKRWDKWKTVDDYVSWMSEVFKECERVLKPTGSFYWFHNDMTQIRKLMNSLDNTSLEFRQMITWNKIDPSFRNHGYVQQRLSVESMRNYYNGFTEYCVFYTFQDTTLFQMEWDGDVKKSNRSIYLPIVNYLRNEYKSTNLSKNEVTEICGNTAFTHYISYGSWRFPTKENYEKLQRTGRFRKDYDTLKAEFEILKVAYEKKCEDYESQRYTFNTAIVKESLRANSNVWLYPPAKNLGHITPKPVELLENIILHSSNEGDVVLDCFMGSGTTAVASVRTGRKFIGFEREPEYIEIANKRLDNETEAE